MRLNSKILYAIISLAFVGGMFTSVYAGPILPTITLAGNVHTTGDSVVDGDLSVDGVSFAALDARITALEATISSHDAMILSNEATLASNVPIITANEAMITTQGNTLTTQGNTLTTQGNTLTTQGNTLTTHDTTLTTHDGMIISNAVDIATNDAMISANQADIATNAAAIESEGGGPNPCNPDGDGVITAQEMWDYLDSQGVLTTEKVSDVQSTINNLESGLAASNHNGLLDNGIEVLEFNLIIVEGFGVPACVFP